jgi:hypothetical protein
LLAVVAMAAAGSAHAASPLTDATPSELRADITRLQAVVAVCAASTTPAPAACDPAAVGDDLLIGDLGHGGYEVHWDWLRDDLKKSKDADAAKRKGLLEDSSAQLGRLAAEMDGASPAQGAAEQGFKRAKATATAVLAQPEFLRDDRPTWWDRLKQKLLGWLFKLFEGVQHAGEAAPWIGPLLEVLLYVGAAVGLLFFLLRTLNRQRLRVAMAGAAIQASAWDREATDWARLAEQHAAAGEWREGVHCLYWAAIVSLEARRAWRHNPTRTPREYLRLLKPGSPQQRALRGLTRIFERVWYGLRDARAEEYGEARGLYESLAAGAAAEGEKPAPLPAADNALGNGGLV